MRQKAETLVIGPLAGSLINKLCMLTNYCVLILIFIGFCFDLDGQAGWRYEESVHLGRNQQQRPGG